MRLEGGRGTLLKKGFPFPSPNPSLSPPKTFDWWGGRATGVRFSGKEEEQGDTRKMEQFRFEMFQRRERRSR